MLSYRKFEQESDYEVMRHIVQQNCIKTGHLHPQIHIGNLDFERFAFDETPDMIYQTTWFILMEQTEIGFVTAFDEEFFITLLCGMEHLTECILEFIEHNCYEPETVITTDANSEDVLLSRLLQTRGYQKTGKYRYYGICDLSRIPPNIAIPEGYAIRQTHKGDLSVRAELFGLATGGIGTTAERYGRMMNAPSYKDALDLVVVTEADEIVAYCTFWNDPISKIGILEPVACIEAHRRKGLSKSLLLYGMYMLKERGTKYMYVGTGGTNAASQALYNSVGFVGYGANLEWQKTL